MVSAISASASLEPHLHLDPTLRVKGRCKSCAPNWSNKITCCALQCCNSTQSEYRNAAIYCDKEGTCKRFDWNQADDAEERIRKTSMRVSTLVSSVKPLDIIREETGIDLKKRADLGQPITVREIKKIEKALR